MMFGFKIYKTSYVEALAKELLVAKDDIASALSFIKAIEQNNLGGEFSNGKSSALSAALLSLHNKHNEIRTIEEGQIWIANGLADFSQILKDDHTSIDEIANRIISQLTKYIGANQGGIFLVNDDDQKNIFFDLKGLYAYGRRKYDLKQIGLEEGLVGQCYLEGSNIYLTEIPSDFVKITSGLGEATPRNVLLVPLIIEEKKVGVIEFASFQPIGAIQIEFLTKVSGSIASLFVKIKESERISKLLEQSEVLTNQLQSREEELNQNLEETKAIQEELNRQNKALMTIQENLEIKHKELENLKESEAELLESKLKAQDSIHQTIIKRLQQKISELEIEGIKINLT
jgi:methyl-accepting chemotaxis protein